jgi:hypothetical protein
MAARRRSPTSWAVKPAIVPGLAAIVAAGTVFIAFLANVSAMPWLGDQPTRAETDLASLVTLGTGVVVVLAIACALAFFLLSDRLRVVAGAALLGIEATAAGFVCVAMYLGS